jgi:hypothetical protein
LPPVAAMAIMKIAPFLCMQERIGEKISIQCRTW